jgi:hypothetical protein
MRGMRHGRFSAAGAIRTTAIGRRLARPAAWLGQGTKGASACRQELANARHRHAGWCSTRAKAGLRTAAAHAGRRGATSAWHPYILRRRRGTEATACAGWSPRRAPSPRWPVIQAQMGSMRNDIGALALDAGYNLFSRAAEFRQLSVSQRVAWAPPPQCLSQPAHCVRAWKCHG